MQCYTRKNVGGLRTNIKTKEVYHMWNHVLVGIIKKQSKKQLLKFDGFDDNNTWKSNNTEMVLMITMNKVKKLLKLAQAAKTAQDG